MPENGSITLTAKDKADEAEWRDELRAYWRTRVAYEQRGLRMRPKDPPPAPISSGVAHAIAQAADLLWTAMERDRARGMPWLILRNGFRRRARRRLSLDEIFLMSGQTQVAREAAIFSGTGLPPRRGVHRLTSIPWWQHSCPRRLAGVKATAEKH